MDGPLVSRYLTLPQASVSGNRLEAPAWFRPFMEDGDDFNQSRLDRPVAHEGTSRLK